MHLNIASMFTSLHAFLHHFQCVVFVAVMFVSTKACKLQPELSNHRRQQTLLSLCDHFFGVIEHCTQLACPVYGLRPMLPLPTPSHGPRAFQCHDSASLPRPWSYALPTTMRSVMRFAVARHCICKFGLLRT